MLLSQVLGHTVAHKMWTVPSPSEKRTLGNEMIFFYFFILQFILQQLCHINIVLQMFPTQVILLYGSNDINNQIHQTLA